MWRWLKLVVAALAVLVVVNVLDTQLMVAPIGRFVSTTLLFQSAATYRPIPPSNRPTIGSIVYLTAHGLPKGTIPSLEQMHASEAYLYVAYYSDAYYQIKANPYGLAEPNDSLGTALAALHRHHIRVIVVISSALLDPTTAPPAGRQLLQGSTAIFDPRRASSFVESLTKDVLKYPIDGLYVGEPYWDKSIPRPVSEEPFIHLYRQLIAMAKRRHVPFNMILPSNYYGLGGKNRSGLDAGFTHLPFHSIGLDGEFVYHALAKPQASLGYLNNMAKAATKIAHGRPPILELTLVQDYPATTPVPPAFFAKELQDAHQAHIHSVILFADEFWTHAPANTRQAYERSIEQFLNNR